MNEKLEEKLRNSDYPKFIKMLESGKYVFAGISACRGINDTDGHKITKAEVDKNNHKNNKNTDWLKDQIKSNNFGAFDANGSYVEDLAGRVTEKSFLVYALKERREELFNFAILMCKVFDQDSILFIDSNKEAAYYTKDAEVGDLSKSKTFDFNVSNEEDYFTKIGTKRNGRNGRNYSIDFFAENMSHTFTSSMFKKKSPYAVKAEKLTDREYFSLIENRIKTLIE